MYEFLFPVYYLKMENNRENGDSSRGDFPSGRFVVDWRRANVMIFGDDVVVASSSVDDVEQVTRLFMTWVTRSTPSVSLSHRGSVNNQNISYLGHSVEREMPDLVFSEDSADEEVEEQPSKLNDSKNDVKK